MALWPAQPSGILPFLLTSISSAWVAVPAAPVWQDPSGRGLAARSSALASGEAEVVPFPWKSVLLCLCPQGPSAFLSWCPTTINEMSSCSPEREPWVPPFPLWSVFCPGNPARPILCVILGFILESQAVLTDREGTGRTCHIQKRLSTVVRGTKGSRDRETRATCSNRAGPAQVILKLKTMVKNFRKSWCDVFVICCCVASYPQTQSLNTKHSLSHTVCEVQGSRYSLAGWC